jgi:hypothetical protein
MAFFFQLFVLLAAATLMGVVVGVFMGKLVIYVAEKLE